MRSANAQAMRRLRWRSLSALSWLERSMKNQAVPRLAIMTNKARATKSFMQHTTTYRQGRLLQLRFWLLTVAALLLAGVTAALGQWQWQRASAKRAAQAALLLQQGLAPLDVPQLLQLSPAQLHASMHRPLRLQGRWLAQQTLFLDNRQMQGKPGFYVLTPLRLQQADGRLTEQAIWVQRGWVARDFQERTRLPQIPSPSTVVSVQARLALPPARLYEFAQAAPQAGERIRQNFDEQLLQPAAGVTFLPLLALQVDAAADGLQRSWAAPDSGVDKHLAYAMQWFGLSLLVVILYAWFQWIRPWWRYKRGNDA